ncbi:hypothetical protein FHR83_007925 [Actinoplanes campanulatus]|uniref:Uncharacterized protein n=1 Tax=Actinoplanes campanulatus TaxID=113559 RepID=A0A7W5AQ54_9ACTN|nr:hypothetical protein [Actinoplanes campanulatus]MBB3100205.1 hypothetical protein [Actinoplanes campanulatus]GGN28888.1 hypothetical protein GCM10010109_47410 [Actinoplanes campanulatus]GID38983.1 hypothetical protein Aca09nite_54890 [Actinoplanes campanulatus]
MSEYQYYEFVALDQALTAKQQGELRAVSSRGRISSSGFVNDYQWGDLKADPAKWMERYFDAHLYLANWGTRQIMLRLPKTVLAPETVEAFCVGESAGCWATRTHVILELRSENEDGDEEWWDEEGRLAAIVPARAELAGGDRRLLYLAWLLCVQNRELDDDEPEPPVPAGLAKLSGPLQALAHFLRLDPDLLDAAAAASRPLAEKKPSAAELRHWVAGLPVSDKDEMLLRLLRGDAGLLRSELLRRFHGATDEPPAGTGRTAGDLLAVAEERWAARQQEKREREAAERQRREEAAAAARQQRLDKLARNPVRAWNQVDDLIATKRPKDYDVAVTLLLDLQALAVREGEIFEFAEQMTRLRERHARKPSLIDRLDRARLD